MSKDIPTGKKIANVIEKMRISDLKLKTEHELELVVWGILCSRWDPLLQWRTEVGGRLCDITLGKVAVEVKKIKQVRDKDRCCGQVTDYLNESSREEVVIVAIDPKNYLVNIFKDNPKVTIIRV